MDSGLSWSGRERNCAYLNLGERRFVDISAATGLDFIEDGRGVARVDADGDGDEDLWLRNRTGPTLRFIENLAEARTDFIGLRLTGVTCNRDAVGARVEVSAGGRSYVREVRAGEGYLAQSSLELSIGLGGAEAIDELTVSWPGGELERFEGARAGTRYSLIQGAGTAEPLAERAVARGAASGTGFESMAPGARVVLRTPLPLPTTLLSSLRPAGGSGQRALLLNLFATWCAPCKTELVEFAERATELSYVGLDVLPICLDASDDAQRAKSYFEQGISPHMASEAPFDLYPADDKQLATIRVLLEHLIPKTGDAPVPTSLLVDKHGMIQVMYLGPVSVDQLLSDTDSFGMQPEKVPVRSSHPGRWFYGMPRNLEGLASAMRAAGLTDHAAYYGALHNLTRRRR